MIDFLKKNKIYPKSFYSNKHLIVNFVFKFVKSLLSKVFEAGSFIRTSVRDDFSWHSAKVFRVTYACLRISS